MPAIALALILSAALGGALSWEASRTLPGDPLYQFKLTINEPVEETLAISSYARAQVELALIAQRLSEAKTLAQSGRLDTYAQSAITGNIDAHVKGVATEVAMLQAHSQYPQAADVASRLYSALQQQTAQLSDLSTQSPTVLQASLAPVLTKVRLSLNSASLLSAAASARAAQVAEPPLPTITSLSATAEESTQ